MQRQRRLPTSVRIDYAPGMPASAAQSLGIKPGDALYADIAASSPQIEQGRTLPPALLERMRQAGLFRLCLPTAIGGLEVEPTALIETVETVSAADGAAGWCVAIAATSGLLAGYLSVDRARQVYGDRADGISGGVFAPRGKAVSHEDGFRVSGRWPFASGIDHCGWLMGGCMVEGEDGPRRLASGVPESFLMLFPADTARRIDTWSVSGLRGTGSHDMQVDEVFVPRDLAVSLVSDTPVQPGPLYRFPVFALLAVGIASVSLGLAKRAIDELSGLASTKVPGSGRRTLAERSEVTTAVARAHARLGGARAFLLQSVAEVWTAVQAGDDIAVADRAMLRIAAVQTTRDCADVIDSMYDAGGGTSIYDSCVLQRCFRDVHTATQHAMVGHSVLDLAGRALLGVPVDVSML